MYDLFTANLISKLPRLRLQGTTVLPSFRKGCTSIAALPLIIRASSSVLMLVPRSKGIYNSRRCIK